MARDVMTIRLHLPQIREVIEDTPGALRVSVESTVEAALPAVRVPLPQGA